MILCALNNSIAVLFIFFKFPEERVLVSSVIFPEEMLLQKPASWTVLIIGGLVNTWILLFDWSIIAVWAVTYMIATYALIFILQELKYV